MNSNIENPELVGQEEFYDNLNQQEKTTKTEWNTDELQEDFKVIGFCGGFCAVERKSDGVKGSLDFDHRPRRYFNFIEASK